MPKLWDKGQPLDKLVEEYTVGDDPTLDLRLVAHDVAGSRAHARMLHAAGILDAEETSSLLAALDVILEQHRRGEFTIRREDEDVHTAIERSLVEQVGDAGKKIHTGRSRNDQVIAAVRLFGREAVLQLAEGLCVVAGALTDLAHRHRETSVPGYTHTRQAMPSTLGLLLGAHAETLADGLPWLQTAYDHLNRCPLGSGYVDPFVVTVWRSPIIASSFPKGRGDLPLGRHEEDLSPPFLGAGGSSKVVKLLFLTIDYYGIQKLYLVWRNIDLLHSEVRCGHLERSSHGRFSSIGVTKIQGRCICAWRTPCL